MSAFDTATNFFHACETLQGWEGCKEFVAQGQTSTPKANHSQIFTRWRPSANGWQALAC